MLVKIVSEPILSSLRDIYIIHVSGTIVLDIKDVLENNVEKKLSKDGPPF